MKLIIIDDEVKICNLIKMLIDFEKNDITLLGMYHDGISGLEAIKNLNPDVVITDIKMPGLDGINLIKNVRDENLSCDFIIVSGHRQFEYAHTAIKYGVENYLLKPINKEELNNTLFSIKEKHINNNKIKETKDSNNSIESLLNKETISTSNQDNLLQIVCIKTVFNSDELNSNLKKLVKDKIITLVNSYLKTNTSKLELYFKSSYCYVLLEYNSVKAQLIQTSISNILFDLNAFKSQFFNKLDFSIGLTKQCSILDINTLEYSKNLSDEHLNTNLFKVNTNIKTHISYYADLYDFTNICNKSILNNDLSILKDSLIELETKNKTIPGFKLLELSYKLLESFYSKITTFKNLDSSWLETNKEKMDYSYSNISLYKTIFSLFEYEIDNISNSKEIESNTYESAINYINKHFTDPSLSLDKVALDCKITSTYLSQLFKENNGMGFVQFVTEKRLLLAKELLRKSNKKIKDIALEVGYTDVKYFTKLFKKDSGIKPSQYRKLYG